MKNFLAALLLALLLCGCAAKSPPRPAAPRPEDLPVAEVPAAKPVAPPDASRPAPEPVQEPEPEKWISAEPLPVEAPGQEIVEPPEPVPPAGAEPQPVGEPVAPPVPISEPQSERRSLSGDPELDEQIYALMDSVISDPDADSEVKLREVYEHIVHGYEYLGIDHYPAGSTDWVNEAAAFILKHGKSNCYGFSALFCLCARELGYDAYVVAGHEWRVDNEHAWVMIDWPDGETYLFDPELECAHPGNDMYKVTSPDGVYFTGRPYYFP